MELSITRKQQAFIDATADEVLFGGAAGGGKSHGQLADALLYALKYKKSKQLILRRTFPELEKSLIRASLEWFPREVYKYNEAKHIGRFSNGSIIDFGYCDGENDVYRYQSAEYDTIRIDELTHFTKQMYVYLMSRCRGANGNPKQMKSSTNPGNIGHEWVKTRFISVGAPNTLHETDTGTRIFIPSKVQDNKFLLDADPEYIKRLENLSEKDKRALLFGDWDIFEGQYFSEFNRDIHTCKPFEIPSHWHRYIVLDYGLDMLAAYNIAVDEQSRAYVTSEIYESNLIISDAAERLKSWGKPYIYLAPPDLWNRRQETGRSVADIFAEQGVYLARSSNDRTDGWMAVKEWLKPFEDIDGATRAKLTIFENCANLIRCIPALQYDQRNPNDVATQPHEITHAPDALRYFCVYWADPAGELVNPVRKAYNPLSTPEPREDFIGDGEEVNVIGY